MAIDNENKRRAAIQIGKTFRIFPAPDGTISVLDRRHIVGFWRFVSPTVSYTLVGILYKHEVSQFAGTPDIYFETYMAAIAGTAFARLRNITDNTVVASSEVSTALTDLTRLRSSAITLTDAKEYRAEAGIGAGDSMEILGAVLLVL